MSSSNSIYCARIFHPNNNPAQRNFSISFESVLREETLRGNLGVLVDIQVEKREFKPFFLSGNHTNFCLSSNESTFFFREMKGCYHPIVAYEVYIDNQWAWVNKLGNQGFALLMKEYATMRCGRQ